MVQVITGVKNLDELTVRAYAKINLALDVLGRREDGYHEIRSVVQTIDLYDRIRLTLKQSQAIELVCKGDGVPSGNTNLAYQAAQLLQERTHTLKGVRIELEKNIPIAAGLGGGSADAAAVIKGLNVLWELGLEEWEMLRLCEELGSDVPYCLLGGTALIQGRGEVLTPLEPIDELWLVLVRPRISVSTQRVYQAWRDFAPGEPMVEQMLAAVQLGGSKTIAQSLGNMLEPVAFHMFPEIAKIKTMVSTGSLGALMSGSGPTVFGIMENEDSAKKLHSLLEIHPWDVFVARTVG